MRRPPGLFWLAAAVVAVLAAYLVAVLDSDSWRVPAPSSDAHGLDRGSEVPEYRRAEFGPRWPDLDGDGCNERQEILARDLVDITVGADGCTVLAGTLHDPYTGQTIDFQHDAIAPEGHPGSAGVQVDHIVSLAQAWRGGAWRWSSQERLAFANDPALLLAVHGPTNASKNDRGPASWVPLQPQLVCPYLQQVADAAARYELELELADERYLDEQLPGCTTDRP